jgi:hypothetical protein
MNDCLPAPRVLASPSTCRPTAMDKTTKSTDISYPATTDFGVAQPRRSRKTPFSYLARRSAHSDLWYIVGILSLPCTASHRCRETDYTLLSTYMEDVEQILCHCAAPPLVAPPEVSFLLVRPAGVAAAQFCRLRVAIDACIDHSVGLPQSPKPT